MNSYLQLIGTCAEKNSFIFGAGPSLWHNMQNPFFSEVINCGIITVVNSAILSCKEPNFFVSCDHLATMWSWWPQVLNSRCAKIVRNSWEKYKDDIKGFYIFEPRKTSEDIIDPQDTGLCYSCSVSSAIDFSIKLKVKRIFVCGLDHNTIQGKHHFWQFFPKNKQPKQLRPAQENWNVQQKVFPIHLQSYRALEEFARYNGVKIYNCNPDSNVNIFEKIKFEDISTIIKDLN